MQYLMREKSEIGTKAPKSQQTSYVYELGDERLRREYGSDFIIHSQVLFVFF